MTSSLHQPPQQQNLPFWTPFAVIQAQPLPAQIGNNARGYHVRRGVVGSAASPVSFSPGGGQAATAALF